MPAWLVLPAMLLLMLAVAWHGRALGRSDHPSSRKRIRLVNAALMLVLLPLMAAGLSLLSSERHPREWALVWLAVMGLVTLSVCLAIVDAFNTLRLLRAARRELRLSLAAPIRVKKPGAAARAVADRLPGAGDEE
jgi:hypothetical protein